MPKITAIALLLTHSILVFAQIKHANLEGEFSLVVEINQIVTDSGSLKVALYNSKAAWLDIESSVRARIALPEKGSTTLTLYGLPRGEYAIAVYQDLNEDNKLNRRLGILPKEPYGFSNNVGKRGPPSFASAKFELIGDHSITINLHPGR